MIATPVSEREVGESALSAPDEPERMKPELRVLQVFSALGMGGAETWLMAMLRYFNDHKTDLPFEVRCDVLLTGGEPSHFDAEATSLGAKLFYLPYTRKKLIAFAKSFRKILANGDYHVIHDHQDYNAGWHLLMGMGRLPRVRAAHVHTTYSVVSQYDADPLRRATLRIGKRLLSMLATDITGTSSQIMTEYGFSEPAFKKVSRSPVYCGFDVSEFGGGYQSNHDDICREFGWNRNDKLLLFIGRLDGVTKSGENHKNPLFALDVARECRTRDQSIRLLLVGAGKNKAELEGLVEGWDLHYSIRFVGPRDDVPRLMTGSDLLLFPSTSEGLGMVAVEAQSAGLRVLASDFVPNECVVLPELVSFKSLDIGGRGWSEEALRLLSLPRPHPQSCNEAVRKSAFSIENSVRELLDIYTAHQPN